MTNINERRLIRELCPAPGGADLVRGAARRRVVSFLAIAVGLGGATGCGGYAITATNGAVFANSGDAGQQLTSALLASASRDLDCTGALEVRRIDAERQYEVSGCGFRAVYDVETPSIRTRRVALKSSDRPGTREERVASTGPLPKPSAAGVLEHEAPVAAGARPAGMAGGL